MVTTVYRFVKYMAREMGTLTQSEAAQPWFVQNGNVFAALFNKP
jgi:hypothetical protein